MITAKERDAIVEAIDAKRCHLTGQAWEGGNGKDTEWPEDSGTHGIP